MKYLYIESEAIKTLTETRFYQSAEFDQALDVVNFIKTGKDCTHPYLMLKCSKDIGYIYNPMSINLTKALIFDLTNFNGFNETKNDSNIITILQMTCRFVRRNWGYLRNSPKERYAENNHAILFPFPLHTYRILLNLSPDVKFQSRKGVSYIAVTADGTSDKLDDGLVEIPCKRIREEASLICRVLGPQDDNHRITNVLDVSEIEDRKGQDVNPNIGYEAWMHLLTNNQKKFIEKEVVGAERLEGAAGTGKTLSLILKAIYNLKKHIANATDCNIVFFAHSEATRKQIEMIFQSNFPDIEKYSDRKYSRVSIEIVTLQSWCAKTLNGRILPTEFLDSDAQASKELQLMYLQEAFDHCIDNDFPTYKLFCSKELLHFLEETDKDTILQMIQSEIAITIKGRANQDIETYRVLDRLEGSLPLNKEGDYNFIYLIYERYQDLLTSSAAFDSDDIVLTALGQLATPLWRRRRNTEGYDMVFIDETHLFNHNELSVFHSIMKDNSKKIIFAIDKTQAIGDRGTQHVVEDFMNTSQSSTKYKTVFRSSPDIVNLAFYILRSGMTLFTSFENPLDCVNSSFTVQEENKSKKPDYYLLENDQAIITKAFGLADNYCDQFKICRHKVLIISSTAELLDSLKKYATRQNKPYECLVQRGDVETIKSAEAKNRYVIGLIDYVGGLEFDAVIILGVDKDRVPPSSIGKDGHIFQNYAWHNRMYVAVSRAKYILALLGDKSRGESILLKDAIANDAIEMR